MSGLYVVNVILDKVMQTLSVSRDGGIGALGIVAHVDEVEAAGCASRDEFFEVGQAGCVVGDGWCAELYCASVGLHVFLVDSRRLSGREIILRA